MSRDRHLREERAEDAVRTIRAPEEDAALERAVALAAAEQARRTPRPRGLPGRRLAAGLIAAGAVAALALTPAGADVRDWMADAIDDEGAIEREALLKLPGGGEVLATTGSEVWIVGEDGARRRLGEYEQATFSPRGLYVAATRDNELTAITPQGEVRWSISRPATVRDPVWSPSGYRIAFLEGRSLGVVAGDGTGAGSLAPSERVRPSWRPAPQRTDPRLEPNELTYITEGPRPSIATIDVDSGRELWKRQSGPRPVAISWAGPDRLLVAMSRGEVRILGRDGDYKRSIVPPRRMRLQHVAVSNDGERAAIVFSETSPRGEVRSRLILARIGGGPQRQRTVFAGSGLLGAPAFSPDDERILLPWLDTDQWLFISPSTDRKLVRRVIAVGDVARQFDPGGRGPGVAPEVEGWCCE